MRRRRLYTFIVTSHADAKLWRLSVPFPVLVTVGLLALIGLVGAGAAFYQYGYILLKLRDYDHLLAENDVFRSENHAYRTQTAQLGEKVDFLETTSHKLMTIAGVNSERGVGGVGGFPSESFNAPLPSSRGTLQSIDGYTKSLGVLEGRYRVVENVLLDKMLVDSAWPAFLPVRGYVTAGLGRREDPFRAELARHDGLDISAPYGTPVHAPADGIVVFAGPQAGYGNLVILDHKFGIVTRYGHLSKMNVEVGQHVLRSDVLGYVGTTGRTTGPHLHYEMRVNNRLVNPQKWLYAGTPRP